MRKIIAAATFGLVLGVAGASSPADQAPEAPRAAEPARHPRAGIRAAPAAKRAVPGSGAEWERECGTLPAPS